MNIFQRLKVAFSREKTLTGSQWKKGLMLGNYGKDKGVTLPFKDSTLVYVAVSKIAENLPQAPLLFYDARTRQQLTTESPIVQLFQRPNQNRAYFSFFEESTLFLALYGETFWYINKSAGQLAGTSTLPSELIALNPTRMETVVNDKEGGLKGWLYNSGKERLPLTPDEVLHIKFPNPYSAYRGFSPVDSMIADVDSDYLAGQYSKMFFVNGAIPGVLFTTAEDDESSKEQKESFMKEFNQLHQGASNSYKTAILNAGMDVKKVGLSQEEMDFIDTRKFNTERVLSAFGVPPPIAGFYEEATYGNVKTAKKIFWNETIKSYARRYENEINNFFLSIYAPGVVAKFNFSDIDELKHDAKETAEIVNIYANHGIPMNALIDSFELPFEHQEGLDVGFQPMTMLEVGTSFLDANNNTDTKMIDVTPKQIVDNTLFNEFSKNLHNYLYRQREKVLKIHGKDKELDDAFWKQENDRLIAKFDPIYAEYGANMDDLLTINNFNKKLIKGLNADQIKNLYNKFDKKLGDTGKSRVTMLSEKEVGQILKSGTNK